MDKNEAIYVAGHRGMVGSAVVRKLQAEGFTNILTRSRVELDLQDGVAVRAFYAAERLETGGVVINDIPTYRIDNMPYGGWKDSGVGREGVKYAMHEMMEQKFISFKISDK